MKHQHKCCTLIFPILWSKHFLSIKVQCCSLFSNPKYFENKFYSWYSPRWLNTLYGGRRAGRSSEKGRKGRFGRFRRLPSMEPLKYSSKRALNNNLDPHQTPNQCQGILETRTRIPKTKMRTCPFDRDQDQEKLFLVPTGALYVMMYYSISSRHLLFEILSTFKKQS